LKKEKKAVSKNVPRKKANTGIHKRADNNQKSRRTPSYKGPLENGKETIVRDKKGEMGDGSVKKTEAWCYTMEEWVPKKKVSGC